MCLSFDGETDRDRQRDRGRQTDRDRDRETERETETERDSETKTEIETESETVTDTEKLRQRMTKGRTRVEIGVRGEVYVSGTVSVTSLKMHNADTACPLIPPQEVNTEQFSTLTDAQLHSPPSCCSCSRLRSRFVHTSLLVMLATMMMAMPLYVIPSCSQSTHQVT